MNEEVVVGEAVALTVRVLVKTGVVVTVEVLVKVAVGGSVGLFEGTAVGVEVETGVSIAVKVADIVRVGPGIFIAGGVGKALRRQAAGSDAAEMSRQKMIQLFLMVRTWFLAALSNLWVLNVRKVY